MQSRSEGERKRGWEGEGRLKLFFCDQTCFCYSAEHSCMRVHVSKGKKLEKGFRKYFCILQISKWKKLHFFLRFGKMFILFLFLLCSKKKFRDKVWNNLKEETNAKKGEMLNMRMVLFIAAATFQLLRDCLTTPIQSCKTLRDKNR